MKVFISHSSKNAWMLDELMTLIYTTNNNTLFFCTSEEGAIDPASNYKTAIYENLEDSDVFIAVISKEYRESKYCIFELGAAYERYWNNKNNILIIPLLLPPLNKGEALADTPLVEMQLANLTSNADVRSVLSHFVEKGNEQVIDHLNVAIGQFCTMIHDYALRKASLLDAMTYGAYFDERGKLPVPRARIAKCRRADDKFEFTFDLSHLDYGDEDPSFASVAFQYLNRVNLREYLSYDMDAAFHVDVDNINGVLNDITIEFKSNVNNQVMRAEAELTPGENTILIPLKDYNYDAMEELREICFVVHPSNMNSLEGEVIFSSIRVEFETKNILNTQS